MLQTRSIWTYLKHELCNLCTDTPTEKHKTTNMAPNKKHMVSNRNLLEFQGDSKNGFHTSWRCWSPPGLMLCTYISSAFLVENHEVLPWGVAEIFFKTKIQSTFDLTLPEPNISPQKSWLEDDIFLLGPGLSWGAMLNSKGVLHFFLREVTILELWSKSITSPRSQLLGGSFPSTT